MKLSHILTVICLSILLAANASALTLNSDKKVVDKGKQVIFSGSCTAGIDVVIEGKSESKSVFSNVVTCSDAGTYELIYTPTFLEPSGKWDITVKEGSQESKFQLEVKPVPESHYFLVVFHSPGPVEHYRNEDLNITVQITDAGKAVLDARAVFFDLEGNKRELGHTENGIYTFSYEIPVDARLGTWQLLVLAERLDGDIRSGGENVVPVGIKKAPIKLDIAKPNLSNFDVDTPVDIEISAQYFNGKQISSAKAYVTFKGKRIDLTQTGNAFLGKLLPIQSDLGSAELSFVVEDSKGNIGEVKQNVVVSADPLKLFIKNYLLIITIVVVVAALAFYFLKVKTKAFMSKKELLAERGRLTAQVTKLQQDYFGRASISKEAYKKRLSEAEARLREVEKKLTSD